MTEAVSSFTGRRRRRAEEPVVPDAEFVSYYGKPVLNKPVWEEPDIPGYLFLGGLAGAASVVAAVAELTGRRDLARVSEIGAAGAGVLSLGALVHDLGRPSRFLNMLRVLKVTSPMSVGSWILAGFVPATVVAAASDLTGRLRPLGLAATMGAASLGPAVASYTAALICDTAVPAWHDGYREMPFVFVASGAMAAGGWALATAPASQLAFPRSLAVAGAAAEQGAAVLMERRMGTVAQTYHQGRAGARMRLGKRLALVGCLGALVGRRSRPVTKASGLLLVASSALTRFGIFAAGVASAEDPRYTVGPQRERLQKRAER